MSTINITPREQELLRAVIEVMKADVDWPTVAHKANFNTPKQARDKWAVVRTKLTSGGGGGGDSAAPTPKASAKKDKITPAKRKAINEDDDEEMTPSKARAKKSIKADTPFADDGEQEAKVKVEQEEDDGEYL